MSCTKIKKCKNSNSGHCKICVENMDMKSYFESIYQASCYEDRCVHNVNLKCTFKTEVKNSGKRCKDADIWY